MHALAEIAALIGEPTRAAMLVALLDGTARPAGELAHLAGLSAPATSLHLAKLTQAGLLAVRREGRHRYYRLASPEVGRALEALGGLAAAPRAAPMRPGAAAAGPASIAAPARPPARPLAPHRQALRHARTCFDHLAGALAIELAALLERERVLRVVDEQTYALAARGEAWLIERLRLPVGELVGGRRPLARRCLDWTERRPHLAGALGAAVLERFLGARWLVRTSSRALRITPLGKAQLARLGLPRAALSLEATAR
jgi:DNA-binding transcriptional ArsR family regulator